MTVATKIRQTIADAEKVAANLKQFALNTDNRQWKGTFDQLARKMEDIVQRLKEREQQITAEARGCKRL